MHTYTYTHTCMHPVHESNISATQRITFVLHLFVCLSILAFLCGLSDEELSFVLLDSGPTSRLISAPRHTHTHAALSSIVRQ